MAKPKARHTHPSSAVDFARRLRNEPTKSEKLLWSCLKTLRKSHSLHFRRQQPIDCYIVDFFCAEVRLVIELHGLTHDSIMQAQKDAVRQKHIEKSGFTVLSFTDDDVLKNPEGIVATVLRYCSKKVSA